jgi:hypothetical protein
VLMIDNEQPPLPLTEDTPGTVKLWESPRQSRGGSRSSKAQLEQFARDARRAPERIGSAHLSNQIDSLWSDARAPGFPSPTLPTPEQAKALSMPVDHCVRLDQSNRLPPTTPNQGTPDPENAVDRVDSRSLGLPAQDQELVP